MTRLLALAGAILLIFAAGFAAGHAAAAPRSSVDVPIPASLFHAVSSEDDHGGSVGLPGSWGVVAGHGQRRPTSRAPRQAAPSPAPVRPVPLYSAPTPSGAGARLVHGTASWYDGATAAAGPALRVGHWRGSRVRVCSGSRCVVVVLGDWCQCYWKTPAERVIDLPRWAFARLADPGRGLVTVTVR